VTSTELERYGRTGTYRLGITAYHRMLLETLQPGADHAAGLGARLQYAIALQHAGLFLHALATYESIERELRSIRDIEFIGGISRKDALLNIRVQKAVLSERIGDYDTARRVLPRLNAPSAVGDARLARASLESWYTITRFKLAWHASDREEMRLVADACRTVADENLNIWGEVFHAIAHGPSLPDAPADSTPLAPNFDQIDASLRRMASYDFPGYPWIALLSAQAFHPFVGHDILIQAAVQRYYGEAERAAVSLGKYFVLGEAALGLFDLALRDSRLIEAELLLRRAFAAFAKSAILLADVAVTRRLLTEAARIWDPERASREVLSASTFQLEREEIKFGEMCLKKAGLWSRLSHSPAPGRRARGAQVVQPDAVFEQFVNDWSFFRLPGRPAFVDRGKPSIDGLLLVDPATTQAIAIQAKLYADPRQAVRALKRPRLRRLNEQYGIRITRYWFVIATSRGEGWNDALWHEQDRERITELIDDPAIEVRVFLEPDLQTDVLIHNTLYLKYFFNPAPLDPL
jgi:hypothetical protein